MAAVMVYIHSKHVTVTLAHKGTLRRRIAYIFFGPPGKYILGNIFL